jgi:hypothetical protein
MGRGLWTIFSQILEWTLLAIYNFNFEKKNFMTGEQIYVEDNKFLFYYVPRKLFMYGLSMFYALLKTQGKNEVFKCS